VPGAGRLGEQRYAGQLILGRGALPDVVPVGMPAIVAPARPRRPRPPARPQRRPPLAIPLAGPSPTIPAPAPRPAPRVPAPAPARRVPAPAPPPLAAVLDEALPEWLDPRPAPAPEPPLATAVALPPPVPLPSTPARRRPRRRRGALLGAIGLLVAAGSAVPFLVSGDRPAPAPAPVASRPIPAPAATTGIPSSYLRLYRRFGREMDVDWRFLAAIGAQESDHGRNPAARRVNAAGCVGPMQIGVGGRCGDFVEAWGVDGNGDGRIDPRAPADAIATAARGLRLGKGAPAPGGTWSAYYHAACAYYGACRDARADYAADVMRRAARYGLRPPGGPAR
jgi:hypothetical protein